MARSKSGLDTAAIRETIPFFGNISAEVVDRMLPFIAEKTFRKRDIVFLEGDAGDEIYFIRSGIVHIYTFEGIKKVIFAALGEGDYFGEMALIKPGLRRSATAEAIAATKVLTLRRTDFERLLESTPQLAFHLLDYTMERLRRANRQIYDMTFLNVRMRIVKKILQHARSSGSPDKPAEWRITHQQLAELVGAVRETVTKVLQELQEEGIIETRNKLIRIPEPERLMLEEI